MMTLREMMVERVLYTITEDELMEEFMVGLDEIKDLSDCDLMDLYEDVMEYNSVR